MHKWTSVVVMTLLAVILASSSGLHRADAAKVSAGDLSFEIFKDARKEYRWRLKAGNGKVIGMSDEGYARKDDCRHAIDLIKEGAANAKVEDRSSE